MSVIKTFCFFFLLVFFLLAKQAGAVGPLAALHADDPLQRQQAYEQLHLQFKQQMGTVQEAEEKENILLQMQLLKQLENLADSPVLSSSPSQTLFSDPDKRDWEHVRSFLDQLVGLGEQATGLREKIREAEHAQKMILHQLDDMKNDGDDVLLLQMEYSYLQRKKGLLETALLHLTETYESHRDSFYTAMTTWQPSSAEIDETDRRLQEASAAQTSLSDSTERSLTKRKLDAHRIELLLSSYDGHTLSPVERKIQRYERLKLLADTLESIGLRAELGAGTLAFNYQRDELLWLQLLGSVHPPFELLGGHAQTMKAITEIHNSISEIMLLFHQVELGLSQIMAKPEENGPKAKELAQELWDRLNKISISLSNTRERSAFLLKRGSHFVQLAGLRESGVNAVATRLILISQAIRQRINDTLHYPLIVLGSFPITVGFCLQALLFMAGGVVCFRIFLFIKEYSKTAPVLKNGGKSGQGISAGGRLKRLSSALLLLRRRLHFHNWFPHIPLAMAIAATGSIVLWRVFGNAIIIVHDLSTVGEFSRSMYLIALKQFTTTAGGIVILLVSIGILRRSRFSWFVGMLLSFSIVILGLFQAVPVFIFWSSFIFLLLLFVFRKHFDQISVAASSLFAVSSMILFLVYGVLGSYLLGHEFAPQITDLGSAFYFTIVTMSTVGYGEIIPKTMEARLFVVSLIIFGITIFTTSITTVIAPLIGKRLQKVMEGRGEQMTRQDHVIIAGDTPLAQNTFKELQNRAVPVTIIVEHGSDDDLFANADTVIGIASDVQTLMEAGVSRAQAVLALGEDDSENAFIVLAVKEVAEKTHTICAVNDSRNISKVRRVKPDMLISPQVLGGELLAMTLSGETPDPTKIMTRFFSAEQKTENKSAESGE